MKEYFSDSICGRFGKDGTFVEFGGSVGRNSRTKFLVDMGWFGYYAEPLPHYYVACRSFYKRNPRVVVDCVAIGDYDGFLKMYLAGAASTGSDSFNKYTEVKFKKSFQENVNVRMTTLNKFLEKHDVPKNFEVLVVDVEGMEWEVFRGFDIEKWRPQAILVESHQDLMDWEGVGEEYKKVENFFLDNKYKISWRTPEDTLFYGR